MRPRNDAATAGAAQREGGVIPAATNEVSAPTASTVHRLFMVMLGAGAASHAVIEAANGLAAS
jgi:hypothetical protein